MKSLLALMFIVSAVCITVFFTVPQYVCDSSSCKYDGIKAIRAKKIAYNVALTSAQNLEKRRDDLTNKYNKVTTEDHQKLEALLPNNVDNIKLVLELETLAKKYGLLIESPKLENTPEAPKPDTSTNSQGQSIRTGSDGSSSSLPYGTFTLDFTVRSTYPNAKMLISDIEHNLRLIEPVAITIKVPGVEQAISTTNVKAKKYPPGTYDVTIRAVIYYLKN